MTLKGLLVEVVEDTRGSQATAAVAPNDADGNQIANPQIPVEDLTDFSDQGGIVDILGEQYAYTWLLPDDQTIDPDTLIPATSGQIILDEPLRAQVDENDPVHLVLNGEVATDAYAIVDFPAPENDDAPDDVAPVRVPIDYSQRPMYPVGPYDPAVPIEVAEDLSRVITVPGVKPTIDATNVINLPTDSNEPTEPPALSPAVELHGTVDSLVVEVAEEYATTTTLDFHISTTPDFTPSDATLVGSSRSAVFVITTPPATDGAAAGGLALNTTYYVRTVARNIIGSAAPGPVSSGMLDPSKVSEVVAARLVAGFILAGSIQIGNITVDPTNGIVIPQSDGSVISFPADGSIANIDAYINARALNVEDDLTISGYGELQGDLQLIMGISNPTAAPVLSAGYDTVQLAGLGSSQISSRMTPVAEYNGRVTVLDRTSTDPHQIGVWDWKTGAKIGAAVLPGLSSNEYIMSMDYGVGADNKLKLWLLTQNQTNWYLVRIDATATTFEARVSLASYDSWSGACIAYDSMSRAIVIVYNKLNASGDPTGTYARARNAIVSSMPAVGGENTLVADSVYVTDAAISGQTSISSANSYVMVARANGGIPAWSMNIDTSANTLSFTRASARDIPSFGQSTVGYGSRGAGISDVTAAWIAEQPSFLLDNGGKLYRLRESVDQVLRVGYTWYDGNATGGTHETALSPVATITVPKAKWPTIGLPPAPEASITDPSRTDIANRIGLYADSDSSGSLYLQSYLPVGVNGYVAGDFNPNPTALNTAYTPPTTNGFGNTSSAPGRVRSSMADSVGPIIDLKGDGSSRLGTFSGSSNGSFGGDTAAVIGTASNTVPTGTWTRNANLGADSAHPTRGGLTISSGCIRVATAGYYFVTGAVAIAGNGTNRRGISFDNASSVSAAYANRQQNSFIGAGGATSTLYLAGNALLYCAAGDYIRMWMYQDTGGDLTMGGAAATTYMKVIAT